MRKTLQIGTVCILLLLHFNLSSAGATEKSSWNLHKQSAQELVDMVPTLFYDESNQTKKKMKTLTEETGLVVELEIAAVIADLKDYQMQLEKEIVEVEKEDIFVKFNFYEKEKKESITQEINVELTQYLEELLFKQ